ncbi:uncharacterized protein MYCFIDRAFT_171737 [Pseudocercospora fijiensis CIRAD86]|uniref:Uncharacterized protein n=1 Tax=Pseudocercospora fijiensis (strain CIRAD86) TaxID=383855 RepID=M2Z7Y9_PSEFD|nr:uncharacterized protein MYCFIDRAFT_171737 [Pseudocercospora fijiensis CIRAD86]EME85885.1 hypothetical protein MYCFIDRAFT_171737 [Pseudocercospora fijiensis CIRAD86]
MPAPALRKDCPVLQLAKSRSWLKRIIGRRGTQEARTFPRTFQLAVGETRCLGVTSTGNNKRDLRRIMKKMQQQQQQLDLRARRGPRLARLGSVKDNNMREIIREGLCPLRCLSLVCYPPSRKQRNKPSSKERTSRRKTRHKPLRTWLLRCALASGIRRARRGAQRIVGGNNLAAAVVGLAGKNARIILKTNPRMGSTAKYIPGKDFGVPDKSRLDLKAPRATVLCKPPESCPPPQKIDLPSWSAVKALLNCELANADLQKSQQCFILLYRRARSRLGELKEAGGDITPSMDMRNERRGGVMLVGLPTATDSQPSDCRLLAIQVSSESFGKAGRQAAADIRAGKGWLLNASHASRNLMFEGRGLGWLQIWSHIGNATASAKLELPARWTMSMAANATDPETVSRRIITYIHTMQEAGGLRTRGMRQRQQQIAGATGRRSRVRRLGRLLGGDEQQVGYPWGRQRDGILIWSRLSRAGGLPLTAWEHAVRCPDLRTTPVMQMLVNDAICGSRARRQASRRRC